jgi:hypothetical protein
MILLKQLSPNFNELVIDNVSIWFSYQNPVAIYSDKLHISKNIWSSTTGKHLNVINPNRSLRVDHAEVLEEIRKAVNVG